jgi:hypothetical protein
MISLASSFQRCQLHSVSITLAPMNPRRTFASNKFRRTFRWAFPAKSWTWGANEHHHRVYLVELSALVLWIAQFWCRLRHLPQRQWRFSNSGEPFCRCCSSLAKGGHTMAFVSSFPFHFVVQSTFSWSSPSNLCYPLFLCTTASCARRPSQGPPTISKSGGRDARLTA